MFLLCILALHFVFSSVKFCSLVIPCASQKHCYPWLLCKYINYEPFLVVYESIKAENKFSVSAVLPEENTPMTTLLITPKPEYS